jgi:3-oxoacyl-[acyl-carrier-protein] synthase II
MAGIRSFGKRRVAVTGLGVVSPIGNGKEAFWQGLISGKCGILPVSHFDVSTYPCKLAAEVEDFDLNGFFTPKGARRVSRGTQFAVGATKGAIEDSKLDLSREDPYKIGLVYGTALGPMDIYERFGATFYERGLKRVNPFFLGMMNHNAMIGALADYFDIRGYNMAISAGCSSGNVALANAHQLVAGGGAEVVVTGGVDTPIYPLTYGLYSASQSMTNRNGDPKKAMCPYDRRRSGFVLGEGAGTLILEDMEHALSRKARIYAEIAGCALTNDAGDSTVFSPEIRDMAVAFQKALSQASLEPEEIDYICGHAHSSLILDRKETHVVKKVFGEHACSRPHSQSGRCVRIGRRRCPCRRARSSGGLCGCWRRCRR